jgi:sec-independent protein translocase protein TatC
MALVPFPGAPAPAPVTPSRTPATRDPWDAREDELETGARMSFLDHLDELRKRLLVAVGAVFVGFLISFAFIERLVDFIMVPLAGMLASGATLIYTEPTEAFILYLKIAALSGLLIAAPIVMWQVWLFIAPGLYTREKRFAVPFVVLTTICFLAGAVFSHYLVFPWAWKFLASFSNEYMVFTPKIAPVFSLYVKMILSFALIFQMPTVVFFLARMGLVSARFLLRNIKYAVLIIFIAAAVLTPTGDVVTQSLMAAPMMVLYLISILIAWIFGKKKRAAAD